jgi:hypothetical protein
MLISSASDPKSSSNQRKDQEKSMPLFPHQGGLGREVKYEVSLKFCEF